MVGYGRVGLGRGREGLGMQYTAIFHGCKMTIFR